MQTKKVLIIDGQGGKIGALLAEQLREEEACTLYAIGTNSIATATMLKAGAQHGATGENPVVVNCRDADVIIGPLGIVIADALLGEVTPAMAAAVGQSRAVKLLLPVNRCNNLVVGAREQSVPVLVREAAEQLRAILAD